MLPHSRAAAAAEGAAATATAAVADAVSPGRSKIAAPAGVTDWEEFDRLKRGGGGAAGGPGGFGATGLPATVDLATVFGRRDDGI
ncbi:hypothetical protein HK405_014087, partial [Cladochytrium tenue]